MNTKWKNAALVCITSLCLFSIWYNTPGNAQITPHTEPHAVVINEIAWAGTASHYTDEWLELYNNTPITISLTGWHIVDDDNLNITLIGNIPPHGYYLIERTNDSTISDIPANLATSFGNGLDNAGQILTLTNASQQIIDTANYDGGEWAAGNNASKTTMERITPTAPGTDDNWASNNGLQTNGLDTDGNPLNGTPKAQNSVFQTPQTADLHLTKTGPHTVLAGAPITYTLTVHNAGYITATHSIVTDTLPSAVQYTPPSSTFLLLLDHLLVWRVGDIAPQATQTFTLTGHVTETATGILTNTISATTTTTDSYISNNTAVWTTTVQTLQPDLSINKRGPLTTTADSTIAYTLVLKNMGQQDADTTTITDTLPHNSTFVSQTNTATTINFTTIGQQLRWQLPAVAPNATITFTIATHIAATSQTGVYTNTVNARTTTAEGDATNNAAAWGVEVVDLRTPYILLTGVLYQGYQADQAGEAIQLSNISPISTTLTSWEICKDRSGTLSCATLPTLTLDAYTRIWLAADAAAFATAFGYPPNYVMTAWFGLANDGDEVIIRDAEGTFIDTLVYNEGTTPAPGWEGPSVHYYSAGKGADGQILTRIRDEQTGYPIPDTNTASDWLQATANITYGRRVLYPGWDVDTFFKPLAVTTTATVKVGLTPDNAINVISNTLLQARESISIEMYTLRHPSIIKTLIQKANEGIKVTLLLEGTVLGTGHTSPDWHTELYVCQQIEATGNGQCWFMIHAPDVHIYNRYNFIHAKMMLVDNQWVVISSQNFTRSSIPADDKSNGTYGSRGVIIATDAPEVVARAAAIFAHDLDPAHHNDLLRWNSDPTYSDQYGLPIPALVDLHSTDYVTYTDGISTPLTVHGEFGFELISAPENALRQSDALLGLIARAGSGASVLVQQAYEHAEWDSNHTPAPNLRLNAYIQAARRGARVRLFINGKGFIPGYPELLPEDNQTTVAYINQLARDEQLDLKAIMGNPTGGGIHNKMVLVNLGNAGQYSHVGSINGSESSSKVNREIALQIQSEEVYTYLATMFAADWWHSQPVFLPLILRGYTQFIPAPPVNYLVISEVYYLISDVNKEWVEIYNPTTSDINLNGYQIGDYDGTGYLEGLYGFPLDAIIPAESTLVIAGNGKNVHPHADYEFFSNNADIPTLQKVGGDGDWHLGNAGDQVILIRPDGQPGDVVVWGTATYPHTIPHPGVYTWTYTLERYPAYYDTNDCSVDFRERYPPSPGTLPTD